MAYRLKKASELRKLSTKDLKKMLQDIGATILLLSGKKASGGGINPGQWRNVKKQKAKILTILGERKNGLA